MIRKPCAAGSFYPADAVELKRMLLGVFDRVAMPTMRSIGVVVPHAGYAFSGQTAAYAYKSLPEKKTFVIIGPSHSPMTTPVAIAKSGAWETPLGDVAVDAALAERIAGASEYVREDVRSHAAEHCIEVQLPFLKYRFPRCSIVPVLISHAYSDYDSCRELGNALASVMDIAEQHVVATSDLTHYGASYGFVPFGSHAAEKVKELDKKIVDAVLSLDAEGLCELSEDSSCCGVAAIAVAIEASKKLGARSGKLLHYSNSYDVTGDEDAMVGYASIALE